MLLWLGRRGERAKRIEAEAGVLIRDYGQQAYSVARRREQEASSVRMAQEWIRIARAVACKTRERVALTTSTRMPTDAHTSLDG
jgi:formylmethanofuran dehydrogenase subunit E